jgi:hypothetical protein
MEVVLLNLLFKIRKEIGYMLKKTIKYTDYNGVEREEDFYFNFNRAELVEMELKEEGGLTTMIDKIIAEKQTPKVIELFKTLILKAYGEKSPDGKRFIKSKELSEAFSQTEAYVEMFMELGTDAKAGAAFVNGVLPAGLIDDVNKQVELRKQLEEVGQKAGVPPAEWGKAVDEIVKGE